MAGFDAHVWLFWMRVDRIDQNSRSGMYAPDVFNECRYETSSEPSSRVRRKPNRVVNSNFALSGISSK